MPVRLRAVLRHGLAVFVALHLFAVTFCALPSVGSGMNRSAWRTPTVQGEFRAWTERFAALGVDITQKELEQRLWDFASGYESVREKILAPFQPYFRYAGTWQSWKMFVAPHRYPGRLEIHLDRGGPGKGEALWEPVYVARSAEHDWMAPWLDHDRFRSSTFRYAWDHYRTPRNQFSDWVARRAAEDFPDARRVRVSFVRYRTRTPEEVKSGIAAIEKRELIQIRELSRFRSSTDSVDGVVRPPGSAGAGR